MSGNPENGRYGLKHVLLYDPYEGMSQTEIKEARKKIYDENIHFCDRCKKNFKGHFEYWCNKIEGSLFFVTSMDMALMCPQCIKIMKDNKKRDKTKEQTGDKTSPTEL